MSTTAFGVNDSSAVKIWSKYVAVAEREYAEVSRLIGDENSIIHARNELEKGKGDQVKFTLLTDLSGAGFTEGQRAEGNGEGLTHYQDSILINELGHVVGVRSENTIDAQRVQFDLRAQARDRLANWWARRKSASFFNHMCGYTPANTESVTSGTKFTGLNSVTAPAGATGLVRQIWPSTITTDQDLISSNTFGLDLIDKAVTRAEVGAVPIRPIMVGGQPRYVVYMHPVQAENLRTNTSAGQWREIMLARLQGGEKEANPLVSGALGVYNKCILRVTQDITNGVNSSTGAAVTNTRRAVLLGAQAAVCAYGMKTNPGKGRYRWSEKLLDHDRELEVGAWGIWGKKKTKFNSVDFGVMVLSTYAADPA